LRREKTSGDQIVLYSNSMGEQIKEKGGGPKAGEDITSAAIGNRSTDLRDAFEKKRRREKVLEGRKMRQAGGSRR